MIAPTGSLSRRESFHEGAPLRVVVFDAGTALRRAFARDLASLGLLGVVRARFEVGFFIA